MAITRWQPFQDITSLQREMNRLMETFAPIRWQDLGNLETGFVPAVEVAETDAFIDLKLEVPGIKPEDMDIQVSAHSVTISGERKTETNSESDGVKRSEFYYGKFYRTVPLSAKVENTAVTAQYQDGVLQLHLPKVEAEKDQVVKVKVS
jgi:HSP20 family protein